MVSEIDPKQVPWWCSSRVGLAFISFLGFINLYALRINFSVAIVCMLNHTALNLEKAEGALDLNQTFIPVSDEYAQCGGSLNGNKTVDKDGEFTWPKEVQGNLLGSFFWGYILTQLPGGWLAVRFGGKRVFGWCMCVCAVVTLLVPVAAKVSYIFILVLRFIAGLGQGVVWPAMNALWAQWAPPLERSKLGGFTYAGSQLGNVVTLPLAAVLCEYGFAGGWPSIFYVFGSLGLLWFIAWMLIVSDSPAEHPRISSLEKAYIQESLKHQNASHDKVKVPWKAIFTSRAVWALIVTHTLGNWGTYTFLTNMPTYMKEILKFDIKSNGLFSAIPYIVMWIVINLSGQIADALRSRHVLTTTSARKLFNTIGEMGPAIFCITLGFVDCTKPALAVVLLTCGVALMGCQYGSGFVLNANDIAGRYSGIIMGISNTAGTLPGFLAPYTIGVLTKNQTQEEWRTVFYLSAGIYTVGALAFLIFGSGETQPWALEEIKDVEREVRESDLNDNKADEEKMSNTRL